MGGSLTCLCPASHKKGVLVMKENGELIKYREGVFVKEVLAAHPYHKIIICGSDPSVLPDSAELDNDRLYFLVPKELIVCNGTYDEFWRVAASQGLISPKTTSEDNDRMVVSDPGTINGQVVVGQYFLFEGSGLKKSPWRPRLQTIPEIVSPRLV